MAGPRIPPKVLSGKGGGEALLHKHLELYFTPSLLEAQTVCAVFQDNAQLYGELGDKAIARAKGQFIRNCQDMVMQELETAGNGEDVFYNNDKEVTEIYISEQTCNLFCGVSSSTWPVAPRPITTGSTSISPWSTV